jgi:hypothetical protein
MDLRHYDARDEASVFFLRNSAVRNVPIGEIIWCRVT